MSILSFGILTPVVWIWVIVEIITVTKDVKGIPFS